MLKMGAFATVALVVSCLLTSGCVVEPEISKDGWFADECKNGVQDADETDVDCGGSICEPCFDDLACEQDNDCRSVVCMQSEKGNHCIAETCRNGLIDLTESDIDCGGECAPCNASRFCKADSDCSSGMCIPTTFHSLDTIGRCWDDAFNGCALVECSSTVSQAMCGGNKVVICQLAANSEMQKHCTPPIENGMPWNANFLCCDPLFL
jgi:hypothetical protein